MKSPDSEMELPLTPPGSGSEGDQESAPTQTGQALVHVARPLELDQRHLGAALGDLKDQGNPVVAALAIAAYRDAEVFRDAVMNRWEQAEEENERLRTLFHQSDKENATLRQRASSGRQIDSIKQICLVLGGAVFGTGLSLAFLNTLAVGIPVSLVGAVVLWIGSPLSGREGER